MKNLLHVLLITVESEVLIGLVLRNVIPSAGGSRLFDDGARFGFTVLAIGFAIALFMLLTRFVVLRRRIAIGAEAALAGALLVGLGVFGYGIRLVDRAYPEILHRALPAAERMARLGLIPVSFDADGGKVADRLRYVKTGGDYGATANVYPVDHVRYFASLHNMKCGEDYFVADFANDDQENAFANCFATNILTGVEVGVGFTYVLDVEAFEKKTPDSTGQPD